MSARVSATGHLHKATRKKRLKCFFPARPVRSTVLARIHFCNYGDGGGFAYCDRELGVPACVRWERASSSVPSAHAGIRVSWLLHASGGATDIPGCTGLQVRLGLDFGVGSVLGCVSVTGGCSMAKLTLLLPAVSSLPQGLSRYSPPTLSLSFRLTVKHIRTYTRACVRARTHKSVCAAEALSSSLLLLVLSALVHPREDQYEPVVIVPILSAFIGYFPKRFRKSE